MNGVPLDNLPAGWRSLRLKWVLEALESGRREVSTTDGFEGGVLSVGGEHIGWQGQWLLDKPRFVSREFFDAMTAGRIRENDILLVKDGATIGKVAIAQPLPAQDCAVNEHVFLLRINAGNHAKYYFYVVQSTLIQDQIQLEVRGSAQPGLNSEFRNVVVLPEPPELAQRSIARYLDRETARIDALVGKKQKQIELLQEKRSALISHAVTKGLDPNVKMKDSGIEWLGEIPESWQAKRLRFLVSEPLKYGANESAELDDPDLPRYIRITDVDENGRLREDTFKSLPEDVARPYLLKEGDLLLARSGATVGKSFYYEPSWGLAAYAGYLIRARFNPARMMPSFVNYFTNSQQYWQWLGSSFIQATIQNVSAEKYANLTVPVPPLPEQRAIAAFLDCETARIDALIEKVEKSIELLREYRTALISAAVTGKIDVSKEAGI
ncbi:MAG: restriction endonuclease subunit S [Nitrospirota bacterium]